MRVRSFIAVVLAIGFVVAGCSSSSDDPASVLTDYAESRNSGDIDAVMAFYADDAVVMGHPLDNDDVAAGIDEIRVLQEQIPSLQGSASGIEYFDIVVSGSTATFSHAFHWSGGGCSGGIDNTATVEDGQIVLFVWGTGDQDLCS
jgi:ketosteroid isomerase-like protein